MVQNIENENSGSPTRLTAQAHIAAGQFSSIEWAINKDGKRVADAKAGYADSDAKTAIPANAIYRIYSMTKPLVSVAALILLEQQKLKLYEPVCKYIPRFLQQKILSADGKLRHNPVPATLEHLLTHRAGLSYDFQPDCPVAELYRAQSLADDGSRSLPDLVRCLADTPAAGVPGERWHYSYATDVLAHIIEIVADQSIAEFLQQYLIGPLNMTDTQFFVKEADQHRLMPMYGSRALGAQMEMAPTPQVLTKLDVESAYPSHQANDFQRGGLGLFSTTNDYMRFAEFLRTGISTDKQGLLSSATFDLLWANRIKQHQRPLKIGPNALPGYGWNLAGRVMLDVGEAMSVTSVGEGGWAGAASTYFWVDRARALSGVIMSQYLGSALPLGTDMHSAGTIEFSQLN